MRYLINQKGSALFIAIGVVLILTIITGTLAMSVNNEIRLRMVTEERVIAKYIAEAGIEHATYEIVTHSAFPTLPSTLNFSIDAITIEDASDIVGSYDVQVSYDEVGNYLSFSSIGYTEPARGTRERSMKIEARMNISGEIIFWQEMYD